MTRPATIILLAALASSALPAAAGPKERLAEMSPADRAAVLAERVPEVAEALAACEAGAWKNLPWETDPSSALAAAGTGNRPLLVFVYKTMEGDPPAAGELDGDGLACLGARITRGRVFSDPDVADFIANHFVPLQVDVASGDLPEQLPALARLQDRFEKRQGESELGFSVSLALSPDGQRILGSSARRPGGERRDRGERAAADRPARGDRLAERLEASGPEAYLEMLQAALSPEAGQRPQRRERKADR